MAQGSWNPVVNRKMNELDIIKVKYDNASINNKPTIKAEWDKKVNEIAAAIRQNCGKKNSI